MKMKELTNDGLWTKCFCGCLRQIFIIPIYELETKCVVCFQEIRSYERSNKFVYEDKMVALVHKRCEPERVSDLFPGPS